MLALSIAAVSMLYAMVGQAGGTAFLALMAFASFSSHEMRPTALLLNIVAATYSAWIFNRGSLVDWVKLRPLLLASLPTALIGGFITLDEHIYQTVTGIILLVAAMIPVLHRTRNGAPDRSTPLWGGINIGAAVGFMSGLTGVGGGVFLAPLLIALHWASPKQTAALTAPFILANSLFGLVGAVYVGQTPTAHTWLYALAALVGAMIGTTIGLRWLSQNMTRYVLPPFLPRQVYSFCFFNAAPRLTGNTMVRRERLLYGAVCCSGASSLDGNPNRLAYVVKIAFDRLRFARRSLSKCRPPAARIGSAVFGASRLQRV